MGFWRLFDETGVKASCTTNAVTFEGRKAMTDAVLERGWERLTYNWEQDEQLSSSANDPAKERDNVLRSLEQFERFTSRAHRVRAILEFIEHAKSLPDVWWAMREEIAEWYLQNHESHIEGQLG